MTEILKCLLCAVIVFATIYGAVLTAVYTNSCITANDRPTNLPTWIEVGGAIALIIGGAVGGPAAARKVKKVLGK
jgi:hypothetical protein